jgi:hypothetical protein
MPLRELAVLQTAYLKGALQSLYVKINDRETSSAALADLDLLYRIVVGAKPICLQKIQSFGE